MISYNDLAKVSGVETFQNELVVSKWIEGRFISVPEKVPGTGNSGNCYDYQDESPNDGNLKVQTISGLQAGQAFSFTQNYTYDSLSRLRTVKDSGLACGPDALTSQRFVYDRYGNKAVLASSCGESSGAAVPFVATDAPAGVEAIFPANRLSNSNPDGSGNQQNWAGKTFVYDGENRLYQANVSGTEFYRYSYDGEGKRVKSQRFETPNVAKESTYYIYDASGQMIVETDGVTPLGANPERKYLTADHLGSTRLMTKSSGTAETIVESRYDYYPFGEEIARGTLGYGASAVRPKFTGQARDGETGLDYFGARYFAGSMGRFTSPDEPLNNQFPSDPQSWNLYGYVRNSPLGSVDPSGTTCQKMSNGNVYDDLDGSGCSAVDEANKTRKTDISIRESDRYGGGEGSGPNGYLYSYPPTVEHTAIYDPVPGMILSVVTVRADVKTAMAVGEAVGISVQLVRQAVLSGSGRKLAAQWVGKLKQLGKGGPTDKVGRSGAGGQGQVDAGNQAIKDANELRKAFPNDPHVKQFAEDLKVEGNRSLRALRAGGSGNHK